MKMAVSQLIPFTLLLIVSSLSIVTSQFRFAFTAFSFAAKVDSRLELHLGIIMRLEIQAVSATTHICEITWF
jgi:hypothetical protein